MRQRITRLDKSQHMNLRLPSSFLTEIFVAEHARFEKVRIWIMATIAVRHDVLDMDDLVARLAQRQGFTFWFGYILE